MIVVSKSQLTCRQLHVNVVYLYFPLQIIKLSADKKKLMKTVCFFFLECFCFVKKQHGPNNVSEKQKANEKNHKCEMSQKISLFSLSSLIIPSLFVLINNKNNYYRTFFLKLERNTDVLPTLPGQIQLKVYDFRFDE